MCESFHQPWGALGREVAAVDLSPHNCGPGDTTQSLLWVESYKDCFYVSPLCFIIVRIIWLFSSWTLEIGSSAMHRAWEGQKGHLFNRVRLLSETVSS